MMYSMMKLFELKTNETSKSNGSNSMRLYFGGRVVFRWDSKALLSQYVIDRLLTIFVQPKIHTKHRIQQFRHFHVESPIFEIVKNRFLRFDWPRLLSWWQLEIGQSTIVDLCSHMSKIFMEKFQKR